MASCGAALKNLNRLLKAAGLRRAADASFHAGDLYAIILKEIDNDETRPAMQVFTASKEGMTEEFVICEYGRIYRSANSIDAGRKVSSTPHPGDQRQNWEQAGMHIFRIHDYALLCCPELCQQQCM